MQQHITSAPSEDYFLRLNPVTGENASRAKAFKASDPVDLADQAHSAFPAWSKSGPNIRRKLLLKAAQVMLEKKQAFITAMQKETGATASWAGFNVWLAAGMITEAASFTTQIKGEIIPSNKPGCLAMSVREPVGYALVSLHGMRPSFSVSVPLQPRLHAAMS